MAIITEEYVSFETAKLLKEKGFNEPCICYSYGNGMNNYFSKPRIIDCANSDASYILLPTQQMAMKWLREKYNLFIEIQCYGCEANEKAHFEFSYVISEYVQFDNKICTTVGLKEKKAKSQHNTYEEACEAAIKYCLENLI